MNVYSKKIGKCDLCQREEISLTFHHLIPKTLHSKKWFKKNYTETQLNCGIDVCRDCHEAVHDFISEKNLGKQYNSLKLLLAHEKVANFISWVRKQKKAIIVSNQSNNIKKRF